MAFEKVIKKHNGGKCLLEQIRVDSEVGRISFPLMELKYVDTHGLGGNPVQFMVVEIDTSKMDHKIRFTPTNNSSEYSLGRRNNTGTVSSIAFKKLRHGTYIRTGKLTYEYAGMDE